MVLLVYDKSNPNCLSIADTFISLDAASSSDTTQCIKIDKAQVVYIFSNIM